MSWQHEASANALFRAWEATACYFFRWGLLGKDVLCSGVEKKWELVTFGDVSGVLLHQDEVF